MDRFSGHSRTTIILDTLWVDSKLLTTGVPSDCFGLIAQSPHRADLDRQVIIAGRAVALLPKAPWAVPEGGSLTSTRSLESFRNLSYMMAPSGYFGTKS